MEPSRERTLTTLTHEVIVQEIRFNRLAKRLSDDENFNGHDAKLFKYYTEAKTRLEQTKHVIRLLGFSTKQINDAYDAQTKEEETK